MRLTLILFLAASASKVGYAQEIQCTPPPGYVCGATEGKEYDVNWVFVPGYVVPIPMISSKTCCVSSVQMNACNLAAADKGCSGFFITNPNQNDK